ncbi:MAG: ribulokinase [Ruminococcaceae bacterium]|nr:ribulokinase [Oscillospiraceae bacterium]
MKNYSIGIDFGTLSGRAVLVRHADGAELASAVMDYPHGVMDRRLWDGTPLPPDFALQHPQDYLDVLADVVPRVLAEAGISAEEIAGVCVDFTSCTVIPALADGTPLCFLDTFAHNPHAYVKLWKHHAAQPQADRINAIAAQRGESWQKRLGGKISPEFMLPKVMEILECAPEVYEAAELFIDAGDWINLLLTGEDHRSACAAGYKGLWHHEEGYPVDFIKSLDPRLADLIGKKIPDSVVSVGSCVGRITEAGAKLCSLIPGTAVGASIIDAHAALPSVGITDPGKLLLIVGTSGVHIVLGDEEHDVPGMCGVVRDGVIPGYLAYEAGQAALGDHFDWFVKNCVPAHYTAEAEKAGMNIHKYLREKAKKLAIGESGLIALDWWNGNRSVLMNTALTGMMVGMTLTTTPEEIYRALLEATAFGTRMILDNFTENGVPVHEIIAAGGIAVKDELMMQIYADVTGREIRIAASTQAGALGSAILGAAAAGAFPSVKEAAAAMSRVKEQKYIPDAAAHAQYEKLYAEYVCLHDYFGRGANDVMKRLKDIRREAAEHRK